MATTDLRQVDPVFGEICKAVYGPEVDVRELWDIAKMNDASEVHVNGASKRVSVAEMKHQQAHRLEKVPGCPYCKTSVRKAHGDSDSKKALAGGLLFGSGAEGLALHRSITNLQGAGSVARHVRPTALTPVKAALKAAAHSKTGKAAEVGIQAVNLGVGLGAARELTKKPKKVTVAKGRLQHIQPAVLHAANARARRNGLRLAGATALGVGAAGGYTAGRRRQPALTATPIIKAADRREKVHYAGLTANTVAGGAGSLFGAAKIRDAIKDEHPAKLASAVATGSARAKKVGVSAHRIERAASIVTEGKPGLKPLLTATVAGAAAGGLHRYGQHLDHKATRIKKNVPVEWVGLISKVNEDKRQVFGWASLSVVDGEPVVDLQGDYIEIEEIEKAAYTYVVESRVGGDMHERVSKFATSPRHTADLIESVVVTLEKLDAWGLAPDAMPLGWWTGYHINDDQQWADVKAGKRLGFSIHGTGTRRELVAV